MKKHGDYAAVCALGWAGYSAIELLWRRKTHWTMGAAGGAGLLLLYLADHRMAEKSLPWRCSVGCVLLSSVELAAGCVINLLLRMNVWDYKEERGNLFGQICPLYCVLWFLLCMPAMALCRLVFRRLSRL